MATWKPSPNFLPDSTIMGTNVGVDTHELIGSVNITGSLTLNGEAVTAGGGGGGGGIAMDGTTANGVLTRLNSTTASVESNFIFDGSTLTVTGDVNVSGGVTSSAGLNAGGDITSANATLEISVLNTGAPSECEPCYSGIINLVMGDGVGDNNAVHFKTFGSASVANINSYGDFTCDGDITPDGSVDASNGSVTAGDGINTDAITAISGDKDLVISSAESYNLKLGYLDTATGITFYGKDDEDAVLGSILSSSVGGMDIDLYTGSLKNVTTLSASSHVSASTYYGDGSNLTGVSASPAGSDTQVQFNDGGSTFGGDAGLTFNKTTNALTTRGNTILGNASTDNHQVSGTLHVSGGIMQQQYFSASISTPVNATCSLYNVFNYHLTANSEITASSPVAGSSYLFFFRQDGTGARTVDFSGFKWPEGTAPTLSTAAGAVDIVSGISDGTYIYADTTKAFS